MSSEDQRYVDALLMEGLGYGLLNVSVNSYKLTDKELKRLSLAAYEALLEFESYVEENYETEI